MFNIGPWELILILVVALIVVGPGKLPEVAKSLGKATNEFKKATTSMKRQFDEAINDIEPAKTEPKVESSELKQILDTPYEVPKEETTQKDP